MCLAGCAEDGDGDADSCRSVQSSVWPDRVMFTKINSILCWAVCDSGAQVSAVWCVGCDSLKCVNVVDTGWDKPGQCSSVFMTVPGT